MRILFLSNSGHSPTGYGVQTKLFVPRLKKLLGHDMTIASFYGLQGAPVMDSDGIWNLPCGRDAYGNDVLAEDARYTNADIVITLIDVWVLMKEVTSQVRWTPWLPVDHDPVPPIVTEALQTAWQPIAYSKFGVDKLREKGIDPLYVPHGVDTKVFKPIPRKKARGMLGGCPEDVFLVGIVAANKGAPSRKAFDQQIRAFAEFNRKHPDSMLYIHTDFLGIAHGEDISAIIHEAGIPPKCIGRPDAYRYDRGMLGEGYMVAVYNACDVVMNATRGEGFGVPILEAQSCGTPVIVTDFSSMPELCFAGWKVPYSDKTFTYQKSYQVIPSVPALVDALEAAYNLSAKERKAMKDKARAGALEYDADKVTLEYWKPALETMAARIAEETRAMERPHHWGRTGLYIKEHLYYPCLDKDCDAGQSGNRIVAGMFPSVIDGVALDIDDDNYGGVSKIVMREATSTYHLDAMEFEPGDVILDIGAHVGVMSTYLGKKWPQTRIIAFEPGRANYQRLLRNLEANGVTNVTAINAAVTGDGRGVNFPTSTDGNTGGLSLYAGGPQSEVDSYSLADIYTEFGIERPKLIKIDCEGAEYEVLEGNEELLKGVTYMAAEFHVNNRFSIERANALRDMCNATVKHTAIGIGGMANSELEEEPEDAKV